MSEMSAKEKRILEILLIVTCVGLACMLQAAQGYKMVILNLFFLPVILSAFFLGCYRGGVLTVLCVIAVSAVSAPALSDLSAPASPLVIGLAITVWASVMGLAAILVGTLSDDRMKKAKELHEAYVGVVEVLSQYLQSAHPSLKARSIRVAELSQRVAMAMKLPSRQIDDIRVAALLYDVGNIEITTKVIRQAVGTFEEGTGESQRHTFQGMDLMLSLGSVLSGAIPLLLNQGQDVLESELAEQTKTPADMPIGASIIRSVRAYFALVPGGLGESELAPTEVLEKLRTDHAAGHDAEVLNVLERTVLQEIPTQNGEGVQQLTAC